jgi:hypothetical protein
LGALIVGEQSNIGRFGLRRQGYLAPFVGLHLAQLIFAEKLTMKINGLPILRPR